MTRTPLALLIAFGCFVSAAIAQAPRSTGAAPNEPAVAAPATPPAAESAATDAVANPSPLAPPSPSVVTVRMRSDTGAAGPDTIYGAIVPPIGKSEPLGWVVIPISPYWLTREQLEALGEDESKWQEWGKRKFDGATAEGTDWTAHANYVDRQSLLHLVLLRLDESSRNRPQFKIATPSKTPDQEVLVHHGTAQWTGRLYVEYPRDTFPWRIKLDSGAKPAEGAPITTPDGRLVGLVGYLQTSIQPDPERSSTIVIPAEFADAILRIQHPGVSGDLDKLVIGMAMGKERAQVEALRAAGTPGAGITQAPPARLLDRVRIGLADPPHLDTAPDAGRPMPLTGIAPQPPVTDLKVFQLQHLPPDEAVTVLQSLFFASATFSSVPSNRTVIANGTADDLQAIAALLSALDTDPNAVQGAHPPAIAAPIASPFAAGNSIGAGVESGEIKLFHLQHLSPDDAVNALSPLFGANGSRHVMGARGPMTWVTGPQFVPVQSQRILIVRGEPAVLEKIAALLQALDVPSGDAQQAYEVRHPNWRGIVEELDKLRRSGAAWFAFETEERNGGAILTLRGSPSALQAPQDLLQNFGPTVMQLTTTAPASKSSDVIHHQGTAAADAFSAHSESDIADLRTAYDKHDARTRQQAAPLRELARSGELTENDERKQALATAVAEAFDARQQLQQAELAELEARLASLRRLLAARERIKDQIVQRRVEELLNPALEWDTSGGPARPNANASASLAAMLPAGLAPGDTGGTSRVLEGVSPAGTADGIVSSALPAGAERLYQGRTESDWQRLFAAETEPAAKLNAAIALLNLASVLPPEQRVERILDIGEEVVHGSYGEAALQFAFESTIPPQRWSTDKERKAAFLEFYNELIRHFGSVPPAIIADHLVSAFAGTSEPRAAFAFFLLINNANPTRGDRDASRRLFERLGYVTKTSGGAKSVLALLAEIQVAHVATDDQLLELSQEIIDVSRILRGGMTAPEALQNSLRDALTGVRLPTALQRDAGVTRALAELVLSDVVERGRTQASLVDPNPAMLHAPLPSADYPSVIQRLREIRGPALPGWVAVANDYLAQHRAPPYSDADRTVLRGTIRAISLYSDGDDWPVARTAELLTDQLRAAYTSDPAATVDQPQSELLPAAPALLLSQIVAITGRIPVFVQQETPKSAAVAHKLATLDRLLAGEIGFRRSDEEYTKLAGLLGEAPVETVRRLLKASAFDEHAAVVRLNDRQLRPLAEFLSSASILNLESTNAATIDGATADGSYSYPSRQPIDPLLLLAIFADLVGTDEKLDARIASLEALDLGETGFKTRIQRLLASQLQSRHHAARILRDMAARTGSAELLDMIRSIDPTLVENNAAAETEPAPPP